MASRREFLQMGAGALGLLTVPNAAFSSFLDQKRKMPFHTMVYDERYPDCELFGHRARQLGAATYAIKGDVSDLWFEDLRSRLAESPGIIAGLTTEYSAHLLQMLGHDVFHHQVFRGDHLFNSGKIVSHRFGAPEYLINRVAEIDYGDKYWSTDMAEMLLQYDVQKPNRARAIIRVPAGDYESAHNLVSWIIAPIYEDNIRRL